MKKLFFFSAVIICFVMGSAQFSNSQSIGKFSVGLELGGTKITSSSEEAYFNGGLNATYRASENWALVAVGSYTTQALISFVEVTGNARYYPSPYEKVKFFGEAGLGTYSVQLTLFGIVGTQKTYLGMNVGGGALVSVTDKIDLIGKIKYHNPFISADDGKINWLNFTFGVNVGM